jgi:hypothetical protein
MGINNVRLAAGDNTQLVDFDSIKEAATDDYMSEIYETVAESEYAYNKIYSALGMRELTAVVETGMDVVYEAADIGGFFAKIRDIILKILAKVVALFKRFMSAIAARVLSDKSFLKTYEKKLNAASKQKTMIKGYKFTMDWLNKARFQAVTGAVPSYAEASEEKATGEIKELEDKHDNISDYLRAKLIGNAGDELTPSEFNRELFEKFRDGQSSPDDVSVTVTDIIKVLKDSDEAKKQAKKNHDEFVSETKQAIREIEAGKRKLEQYTSRTDDKGNKERNEKYSEHFSTWTKSSQLKKDALAVCAVAYGAQLKALKDKSQMYKSAASRIVSGMVKEQTIVDESSLDGADRIKSIWDNVVI